MSQDTPRSVSHASNESPHTPTAHPPPPPSQALHSARRRKRTAEALTAVERALKQHEAHLLRPNDLVWLTNETGAWRANGAVAAAIARWLDHHGDIHPGLFASAVEIAALDDNEGLDAALLLARPDSFRWLEHAKWTATLLVLSLRPEGAPAWRFEPLSDDETTRRFRDYATSKDASYADHARVVLAKRGANARTGLQSARGRATHGTPVRLLLDVWEEAFT